MDLSSLNLHALKSGWEVFLLFLIPFGFGIPSGVLLAINQQMPWPMMMVLYFISDVVLAFWFEPVLKFFIKSTRRSPRFSLLRENLKTTVKKSIAHFGTGVGPLALVLIALGVDPMTGRAASYAAGYGFVMGWVFAIIGDMINFTIFMVATVWLKNELGNGTAAVVVLLAVMIALPVIIRRIREYFSKKKN